MRGNCCAKQLAKDTLSVEEEQYDKRRKQKQKKRKAGSSKIKVESQQDEKCKPFMVALASIKERHSVNSMGLNGLY